MSDIHCCAKFTEPELLWSDAILQIKPKGTLSIFCKIIFRRNKIIKISLAPPSQLTLNASFKWKWVEKNFIILKMSLLLRRVNNKAWKLYIWPQVKSFFSGRRSNCNLIEIHLGRKFFNLWKLEDWLQHIFSHPKLKSFDIQPFNSPSPHFSRNFVMWIN